MGEASDGDRARVEALEAALAASEARCQRAEERLARLVDLVPDGGFYVDRELRFVDGNPHILKVFHAVYGVHLRAGEDAFHHLPAPLAALWRRELEAAVGGEERSFHFRERVAGAERTYHVRLVPHVVGGAAPRVVGVACVTRDLTSHFGLQQDLVRAQEEVAAILESAEDAIWSVDATLRLRMMNGRFVADTLAALGVRPEVGQLIPELLGPRFASVAGFYAQALRGEVVRADYSYRRPTADGRGELREMEVQMRPLRDGAGAIAGVTVFAKDVTERRGLLARAVELDRLVAIGTLAAGVGHEINNPLAFVMTNIELVRDLLTRFATGEGSLEDAEDGLAMMADAEDGAARIRAIVRELRTLSRADGGDAPTLFDARSPVQRAIALAGHELRLRAELTVHAATDEPLPVRGADGRVTQVFVNLLVNAAQAIPAGRRGAVTVTIGRASGHAVVTVDDDGAGIAPEVLARAFEAFFTTKPRGEGTGLGLPLARRIVLEHGGDLVLAPRPSGGTRATVHLPLSADP